MLILEKSADDKDHENAKNYLKEREIMNIVKVTSSSLRFNKLCNSKLIVNTNQYMYK